MDDFRTFKKLLPYLKSVKGSIRAGIVTGILHQLAAICVSVMGAYITGLAVLGKNEHEIILGIIAIVMLILVRVIFNYLEMWYAHKAAYGILADLRVKIYYAINRVAPAYLLNRRTGDLSSLLMADVETLEWFYAHTYGAIIIAIAVSAISLILMGVIVHPLISLVLLPFLLMIGVAPFLFMKNADVDGAVMRGRLAEINADVTDGIQGLREILSFGYESYFLRNLRQTNHRLTEIQCRYGNRQGLESGLYNLIMSFGMLAVAIAGKSLIAAGAIQKEYYAVAVIFAVYVFTPVLSVSNIARNFGAIKASVDRIFTVLEEKSTVEDLVEKSEPVKNPPDVTFENVSFRYKNELPLVLNNMSFSISPGETVALTGPSGIGKTTCANLLMRFWDVTEGAIKIGGVDIRKLTLEDLRSKIAYVPQDVYLFNKSIGENIKLGRPDASEEEVIKAAKEACIHDFIASLPEGYDTVVGERGVRLSGGEKQRIAIARAFLLDAPILIMDEAVSNLDSKNEEELRGIMAKLHKDRTTLLIAHRESTICSADRSINLQNA